MVCPPRPQKFTFLSMNLRNNEIETLKNDDYNDGGREGGRVMIMTMNMTMMIMTHSLELDTLGFVPFSRNTNLSSISIM